MDDFLELTMRGPHLSKVLLYGVLSFAGLSDEHGVRVARAFGVVRRVVPGHAGLDFELYIESSAARGAE